jgi:hypothetical protein
MKGHGVMRLRHSVSWALAGWIIFAAGCRTAPQPVDNVVLPVVRGEQINTEVAEDQTVAYQGQRLPVTAMPEVMQVKNSSKRVVIFIYPDSKVREDTVKEFIKNLQANGYVPEFAKGSKYSYLPIPK